MRMVPAFEPLEDRQPRLSLTAEAASVEDLPFERGEEALSHGVIVGIARGPHRRHHAGGVAAFAEGVASVLLGFKVSSQHRVV